MRNLPSVLALTFAGLILGCGSSATPTATVSGTVKQANGSILPGGKIDFRSTAGQLIASGMVKADGTFAVGSVPLGDYKVTIENADLKNAPITPAGTAPMPGADRKYVPIDAKFTKAETTPIVVKVDKLEFKQDVELK